MTEKFALAIYALKGNVVTNNLNGEKDYHCFSPKVWPALSMQWKSTLQAASKITVAGYALV